MHQSKDAKQSIKMEFFSVHAQSVALECKDYLSKALIQRPRNTEDSALAYLAPFFEFFFTV